MDTACDGWVGTIAWEPGADPALDRATRPYGYPRAAAYLGNELQVSGRLYGVAPLLDDAGRSKTLTGYSFTADVVDSHMPPPYERANVTIEQLAAELCPLFGIKSVFHTDTGGPFAEVTAHESESVFQHLAKLCAERGLLVSCTPAGDLLFHRAVLDSPPVGTLAEGEPLVTQWKADYNGRDRFHSYKCITSGSVSATTSLADLLLGREPASGEGPSARIEIDRHVPVTRFQTFQADNVTPGNAREAARWAKNKQLVAALTQEISVSDWYAPNGHLWEPNTLVTVVSPTLGVPRGYNFLIRAVEFLLEDRRSAVLYLVPPVAYSRNKDLGEVWTLD
jgi:prophage tail gpP-like protein